MNNGDVLMANANGENAVSNKSQKGGQGIVIRITGTYI